MMIKRYIKENKDVLKLINNKYIKIIEIKPIKKITNDYFKKPYISSYCVIYEKLI